MANDEATYLEQTISKRNVKVERVELRDSPSYYDFS